VARLRETFDHQHVLHLPQFLPAELLCSIQAALARAAFQEDGVPGLSAELRLAATEPIYHHLLFMMNDPALFRWVEQVTGCETIGRFSGRVYRRSPGTNHYVDWHSDCAQTRMIGISVNLSTETFSGGTLKLRDRASRQHLCETANTGFGDAVLFRISPQLEHIVMPTEGTTDRTALAGWFRREPDYMDELSAAIIAQRPMPCDEAAVLTNSLVDDSINGLPTKLRLSDDALYHAVGDDLFIHVNRQDGFYKLNAVGREILERLVSMGTPATVIAEMLEEYDAPAAELTHEVYRLIAELHSHGVLAADVPETDA